MIRKKRRNKKRRGKSKRQRTDGWTATDEQRAEHLRQIEAFENNEPHQEVLATTHYDAVVNAIETQPRVGVANLDAEEEHDTGWLRERVFEDDGSHHNHVHDGCEIDPVPLFRNLITWNVDTQNPDGDLIFLTSAQLQYLRMTDAFSKVRSEIGQIRLNVMPTQRIMFTAIEHLLKVRTSLRHFFNLNCTHDNCTYRMSVFRMDVNYRFYVCFVFQKTGATVCWITHYFMTCACTYDKMRSKIT